jgi:predicted O-methyltransferase YrrM
MKPAPFVFEDPITDPLPLYRMRDGLMAADLFAAAVSHLNLYTWLAQHPSTLGAICAQFSLQLRPADVLMTLSAAHGLVTQAGGVFHLTARAREHLVEGSPFCLKPYYDTLKQRPQTLEFLEVLRTDRTANWSSAHANAWAEAMENEAFADQFTAAMDCRGVLLGPALARALDLSGHRAVLDIAGGSGIYSCALAAHNPHLLVTVFEKAPVDRIAHRAIARRGYGDRVSVKGGDMFSDAFPEGFDVLLLSNVLHDWSDATARALLEKAARAVPEGGLLVVHDAFLNPEKTGPLPVAQYSALLMHSTEGRCFSTAEIRQWAEPLGLEWRGHHATAVDRSILIFERN